MVRSTLLEDFALAGPKGRFATSNAKKLTRFFGHLWRQKCHSEGSQQNTSPLNILVLSENTFISSKNRKNRLSRWCPKFFFVTKNFMFVMNSLFSDFRCLELNFERNRDQEWACFG